MIQNKQKAHVETTWAQEAQNLFVDWRPIKMTWAERSNNITMAQIKWALAQYSPTRALGNSVGPKVLRFSTLKAQFSCNGPICEYRFPTRKQYGSHGLTDFI